MGQKPENHDMRLEAIMKLDLTHSEFLSAIEVIYKASCHE